MNSRVDLGFSNIAWPEEMDDLVLSYLQKAGITTIDVSPFRAFGAAVLEKPGLARQTLARIRDHGMSIVAFQSLLYTKPDANVFIREHWEPLLDHFKAILELACLCGTRILVFGSPRNRRRNGLAADVAVPMAAEFFRKVGDLASPFGVSICIESNSRHYECDFLTTVPEAARFVLHAGHPNVRLHLDLGNMLMENEDWDSLIRIYAGLSPHFHLSAPYLRGTDQIDRETLCAVLDLLPRFYKQVSIEMLTDGAPQERLSQISSSLNFVSTCQFKQ